MRRPIIPYNPVLRQLARNLRNRATPAEAMLWNWLRRRQMRGYDFHRQKPVGEYIVDFFCSELCLAIELDGRSHWGRTEHDGARQKTLEGKGVNVIRFSEYAVRHRKGAVLDAIAQWIEEWEKTHPSVPSQEGKGELNIGH